MLHWLLTSWGSAVGSARPHWGAVGMATWATGPGAFVGIVLARFEASCLKVVLPEATWKRFRCTSLYLKGKDGDVPRAAGPTLPLRVSYKQAFFPEGWPRAFKEVQVTKNPLPSLCYRGCSHVWWVLCPRAHHEEVEGDELLIYK